MKVVRLLGAVVAALLWTVPAGAQGATGTITGKVVDSASQAPISNATILIVGSQRRTLSRNDGSFSLPGSPAGANRVRVSRIGYAPLVQQVQVTAGQTVTSNFALVAAPSYLSEVVTVGYGTQRREAVTGAIATVRGSDANVGVQSNANGLIQGRVAGVSITTNSGEPGAGAQVRIRGGTSISASNEPLYVIDGVPLNNVETEAGGLGLGGSPSLPRSPLNLLNPSDIETITILKDASSTAIYGSRGANGVVLIETKRGASGSTAVEYEGFVSVANAAKRLEVLNGNEYRAFVQQQVTAGALPASRLTSLGTSNTNWADEVMRSAATQNHNLTMSGGTRETRYRASLNYQDQQGVAIQSGFQRFQGRLNANTSALQGKLLISLNLTASTVRNKYIPTENTGGFEGGVFTNMVQFNPTRPVLNTGTAALVNPYYELGPGRQSVRNPVALANQIADNAETNRTLANVNASYTVMSGLTAQLNVGVDRSGSTRRIYWPSISPAGAEFTGRAQQQSRNVNSQTLQALLTYNKALGGNQEIEILGGYEYAKYQIEGFGAEARNFLTDAFTYNNLGGGATLINPYSFATENRLASFFGKANYSLRNRYFLTGVVRRDGASVFGAGNKWSTFPAISAAWRLSEEGFMRNSPFSEARLRVSYGLQGNQGVQPFQSLTLLGTGGRYIFGNTLYTGISPTQNPNPNLKWETTAQTGIAFDYGVMNNKVTGTLEYYEKKTSDLLLTVNVPAPAVVGTQLQNIGNVTNKGLEFSIDASLYSKESKTWNTGLVMSIERNQITSLGNGVNFIQTGGVSGQGQSNLNSQRIQVGKPIGTFWGPEYLGLNATGQQTFRRRSAAGADSGITLVPTDRDFVDLGNANPLMSLGLTNRGTWGSFDFSMIIRSNIGGKVFNNTDLVYGARSNVLQDKNFLKSALDDKTGITEPAIFSSRFIEDASFVRLQNITVGYAFKAPSFLLKNSAGRVYLSADNLLLLTGYNGLDPEVFAASGLASRGIDYLSYARPRTFTAGIKLGL